MDTIICHDMISSIMKIARRSAITLGVGVVGAASVGLFPGIRDLCKSEKKVFSGSKIKVSPIPGQFYPASLLAFMEKARFETPQRAIHAIKNPCYDYYLEYVSA